MANLIESTQKNLSINLIVNSLEIFLKKYCQGRTVWVGYSGGLDSSVLLYAANLASLSQNISLRAVYINHGVHTDADLWSDFCKKQSQKLEIQFIEKRLDSACLSQDDLENKLRRMRYAEFKKLLANGDFLLTAHHNDDQAETVLMQMIRGAGPRGLSAMPLLKSLGDGFHARPFLKICRSDLKLFAKEKKLKWIEDSSNKDARFTRNYLRREILPQLQKRWPNVSKTLARVADNCADNENILQAYIQADLKLCIGEAEISRGNSLCLGKLKNFSPIRQTMIIREWIVLNGFLLPSRIKIKQLLKDMLDAKQDRFPCVAWIGAEVRRFKNKLYIMQTLRPHDKEKIYSWNGLTKLTINNIGELSMVEPCDINFIVKFRKGGENFKAKNKNQHKTIKNLFQESFVPVWMRDRVPLIFLEGELFSIPNIYNSELILLK